MADIVELKQIERSPSIGVNGKTWPRAGARIGFLGAPAPKCHQYCVTVTVIMLLSSADRETERPRMERTELVASWNAVARSW